MDISPETHHIDHVVTYTVGMLVENPKVPAWGPGKVVRVEEGKVQVIFRDTPERMAKLFHVTQSPLIPAAVQSDPTLDNLPAVIEVDGKLVLPGGTPRISFAQALDIFLRKYSQGFSDPGYLQEERNYKLDAHEKYVAALGNGQGTQLLQQGQIAELSRRACSVIGKVNLLSQFEQMAFRDALQDQPAATRYFTALFTLLDADTITAKVYQPYLDAVAQLPQPRSRVVTWPVTTLLPFLAQPDRHMFLKPDVTVKAAESLTFHLNYTPQPNWNTYAALLRMGEIYRDRLSNLAPRDFIDVQSFLWVTGSGYE
ncbi:MAG: hypothetical protein ACYDBB_20930 [Armatimonadota bacterium]